ncbi:MAG TPA: hypothetical protein VEI28_06375, partial [Thermodesulfovibrionales bacterium]|nr:hypothetical protein [Thermodesulfovibrionales bacterium]
PFGVKDVRFRVGKVHTKAKETARPPHNSLTSPDRATLQQIEETIAGLEDGPVKESIRKTMEKSLSAGKLKR